MTRAKEEKIRKLLKDDEQAQQAFNRMLTYYQIYDLLHYTSHSKLIKSIYLDYKRRFSWQLENIANVGHTTCFAYRKKYIQCFYLCMF